MKTLILILIFAFSVSGQIKAPTGWRFPNGTDFIGKWKEFKKDVPSPYKISADFNSDKLNDEAWILIPTTGKAMGVFVFLQQKDKSFRSVQLDYFEDENPQQSYLSVMPVGKYDTACGKGYWDCSENEPPVLDLKSKGIYFGEYESSSKVFYWNPQRNTFESVGISD